MGIARRWKVEGRRGEGEGWKQPRQVGVDSKKVDGGGSDDDEDDDGDGEKRKTGRASNEEKLINIHDEIYPSIITGPEIYAREARYLIGVAPPGRPRPVQTPGVY